MKFYRLKVVLFTFIFCSLSFQAFTKEKVAEVSKVSNVVQIKHKSTQTDQIRWKRVVDNIDIFSGYLLRTGVDSATELKYNDGSITRLGGRSSLVFRDEKNIRFNIGKMWTKITTKKEGEAIKIYTDNLLTEISEAELLLEVDPQKNTFILVLAGEIKILGQNGEKKLNRGKKVKVNKRGYIFSPNTFNKKEEIKRYQEVIHL